MQQTRIDLEACVAACVMMENGANVYHVDIDAGDFTYPPAKAVIAAAKELQVIDILLVRNHAKSAGLKVMASDISGLLNILPTSKNFMSYLAQLKAEIYRVKVDEMRRAIVQDAKTGDVVELAENIREQEAALSAKYLERQHSMCLKDACCEMVDRIDKGHDNDELIPTGVLFLDQLLGGGLLPNEVMIIAARPSIGKTAMALQIAADCNEKCLFVSLEMSKKQIVPRLLASVALRNTRTAARKPSELSPELRRELLAVTPTLLEIAGRIMVVDDHDLNIESTRRIARKAKESGAKFVIIDYLQLYDKKAETRERALSQVSREMKNMGKELNIPVICLAQVGRAVESENRTPRLSDLRESGAIEQDASIVLFIHKTGEANGKKQVAYILAKGRDVGEGFRKGIFNPDHQRFYAQEEF